MKKKATHQLFASEIYAYSTIIEFSNPLLFSECRIAARKIKAGDLMEYDCICKTIEDLIEALNEAGATFNAKGLSNNLKDFRAEIEGY